MHATKAGCMSNTHKKECPLDAQMSHAELIHLACTTHGGTLIVFVSKHAHRAQPALHIVEAC